MAPKGKGNNEDLKQEDILQAVVIADSFNVRFGPVTRRKPRALLPLVNVPLIDYTLQSLSTSGVQEVFVFCCHLGDQVREHISQSKWQEGGSPMTVTTIKSDSCLSIGDALREIDARSLIQNDFILITGDIVSNMDISQVVKEHKARTQGKDKSSVMTLVFKVAQPKHRSRSKEQDMFLVEEGRSGRLLFFKKILGSQRVQLPVEIMLEHDDLVAHNDLMDCHICVCSPIVAALFTDNFDYLTRDDFVKGILINEEIMGHKIHLSMIRDKYATRVSDMQTYDAVSKDIMGRWTYPFVPDLFGSSQGETIKYGRHNVYCSVDVTLARGCELVKDVVVGGGTFIGSGSVISNCVIGRNCQIGQNVILKNSFLWDNVTIEDNCVLDTALLCSGVKVWQDVTIKKGVILAWDVQVGPAVEIPQGTQLISELQTDDFDDLDESFGDDSEADNKDKGVNSAKETGEMDAKSVYGEKSLAFVYKENVDSDDEEEGPVIESAWGLSGSDSDDKDYDSVDSDSSQGRGDEDSEEEAGGMGPDSDDNNEDFVDSSLGFNPRNCVMEANSAFFKELVDTFVRAKTEKVKDDNLILEINSLKHAYTVPIAEVIQSLPCSLFQLSAKELGAKISPQPEILSAFEKNVARYSSVLSNYIKNSETQLNCINGIGDFVIRHSDLRPRLPQLLNILYDADILGENIVISWFNTSHFKQGSDEAMRHAFLRKLAQPFVVWLQEAEEESSEEEDDED